MYRFLMLAAIVGVAMLALPDSKAGAHWYGYGYGYGYPGCGGGYGYYAPSYYAAPVYGYGYAPRVSVSYGYAGPAYYGGYGGPIYRSSFYRGYWGGYRPFGYGRYYGW